MGCNCGKKKPEVINPQPTQVSGTTENTQTNG